MPVKISSKYQETKERLRNKILEGKIEVEKSQNLGALCYFCGKPVKENALVLIDKDGERISRDYSDIECYLKAKNNFYLGNIYFSVN